MTYSAFDGLFQKHLDRLVHIDEAQPALFAAMELYSLIENITFAKKYDPIFLLKCSACLSQIEEYLGEVVAKSFFQSHEFGLDCVVNALKNKY